MHKSGLGLLLMGIAQIVYAALYDVSVPGGFGASASRTINIGLQQTQLMIYLSGLFAVAIGTMLCALAQIADLARVRLHEISHNIAAIARLARAQSGPEVNATGTADYDRPRGFAALDAAPTPPSADSPPRAYKPPAW